MPLWEIARGPNARRGERIGRARAVFALGDVADGVVAVGGIARGVIAVGGISFGVLALGGVAFSLLAGLGGVCFSAGAALGGVAIAPVAQGEVAAGIIAHRPSRPDSLRRRLRRLVLHRI